jgi:hypothetical protein
MAPHTRLVEPVRARSRRRGAYGVSVALLTLALLHPLGLRGDEIEDRRIEIGARLFRALLAADLDLQKKTASNDRLHIVFFYAGASQRADDLVKSFDSTSIRELPVTAEATNDPSIDKRSKAVPAGIFIVDLLPRQTLKSLIRYGIEHHVIVYSPFEGDVESGVLGGLSIEAQVRPFLNQATLDASHIVLKPIFMKVAKVYP